MISRETTARKLVAVPDYADEVVLGLTSWPKTLPCKLFYDDVGSALFERITELPEYYPTRIELEILQNSSREIALAARSGSKSWRSAYRNPCSPTRRQPTVP